MTGGTPSSPVDAVVHDRGTGFPVATYTLESAYASVPALDPPRGAKTVEGLATEEKVARTVRELCVQ